MLLLRAEVNPAWQPVLDVFMKYYSSTAITLKFNIRHAGYLTRFPRLINTQYMGNQEGRSLGSLVCESAKKGRGFTQYNSLRFPENDAGLMTLKAIYTKITCLKSLPVGFSRISPT